MSDLVEPLPGVRLSQTPHRLRGYLLYLGAALFFAINGTVSKTLLLDGLDPARLSQLRVTGAFVILLLVVALTRPRALRLRRQEVLPLLVYGIAGVAMTQYLYFVALQYLPVGVALLIEFTAPILVALWFRFGYREPTRATVWLALVAALIGLSLVAQVWQGFTLNPVGVFAAAGAAVALAIYYILGDREVRRPEPRDPVSLTMWGFGAASLFWVVTQPWWTFPWSTFVGTAPVEGVSVPLWVLATWMVILGTIIPFWLVVVALKYLRASQASTVGLTEPLLAILIAWVVLGESLTWIQIIGGALILTGVVIAERSR
jgi:drug/metabolite transporter (DMT)-like permease